MGANLFASSRKMESYNPNSVSDDIWCHFLNIIYAKANDHNGGISDINTAALPGMFSCSGYQSS